jgi:hypothetical protein
VAVTVDLMLEGDSVFISAVHTSRNAARYSDRIVFNAVLDFALDSGLLTVYSRNSVPEQYSSNRTHARGGEYWKVTVQENSKRIAALEIPASTTTPQ